MLLAYDSAQAVKAWFIGLNPQLGDVSPAEAIHDGRLKESLAAARILCRPVTPACSRTNYRCSRAKSPVTGEVREMFTTSHHKSL